MPSPFTSPTGPALPEFTQAEITILGLGPGDPGGLTLAGWQALQQAARILLRTRQHPCVDFLAAHFSLESCDDLYETHEDFADIYSAIVERVLSAARPGERVVYAVPGHPWVGEATTPRILAAAQEQGRSVQVLGAESFVVPSLAAVGVDIMDGGQVVDAMILARQHHPQVEVGLPLLVGQIYARWLASDVKLTLMNAYPDDHPVTLIYRAGTREQRTATMPLHALDQHEDFDHLTSLYLPPLHHGSFTALQEIVAHLRAPEGCPWDQEQTLESLRQDLLGECAEVLEAIDMEAAGEENGAHIAEELGDVLLVATMMVQIATEEGRFKMADVIRPLLEKLIRRHPHVFGDTVLGDAGVDAVDQVLTNWEQIKAAERAARGEIRSGPLDGIPAHLPALEKARKLQSRAERAGLLAPDTVASEVAALFSPNPDAQAVGERLWALVAFARQHGINPEDALRTYLVQFRQRHGS
ncbi:MazG family protein [Litorilinea aerophila]|uniref:MazG family protein n=1 Tax=Litorilinea aerophila TaxID=1204385 RepID=A0A540VPE6_9CHLR|nr:MazG family protein [Litorilinea aerophila]MCC9074746.1 MazG family protein [Litorilinea aerophila]